MCLTLNESDLGQSDLTRVFSSVQGLIFSSGFKRIHLVAVCNPHVNQPQLIRWKNGVSMSHPLFTQASSKRFGTVPLSIPLTLPLLVCFHLNVQVADKNKYSTDCVK